MRINTNIGAIKTADYLRKNNAGLDKAMEKLASGLRINKAGDDAAGLAISTRMTTQIRGMEVAVRNASDGISLLQTAESALGSISNILQRMRELAVQADNGTLSVTDKDSLQSEVEELKKEIQHVSENTKFNGIALLDGSNASIQLHISDAATDVVAVTMYDALLGSLGDPSGGGTATMLDAINVADTASTVYPAALAVTYGNAAASALEPGDAQGAIQVIDVVLDQVSGFRAAFGAMQNRLEFTVDNLSVTQQNTTEARSRIQDADMAKETSTMTKQKILAQASISMLSQANQQPQMILNLLQQ